MNLHRYALLMAVLIAAMLPFDAMATRLMAEDVGDPFSDSTCPGQAILSFGSYIYQWPSKFDGVFWPATDARWLWFCAESGYVSLGSDFLDLSDSERERIGHFLVDNYDAGRPPIDILDRLAWAERIYDLRDKDDAFRAYFRRANGVEWTDDTGVSQVGHPYFDELIAERKGLLRERKGDLSD